jgi:peptidoglycan-N-acetylglucosamine deacetylase
MDDEKQQDKLKFFIKTGIVVLSFLVLLVLGIKYIPTAISVTNSANTEKLPIYCVDEKDNKVALSFDAAWGNGR